MKRLVSILLMNAWGGLRHKASLPTVSMVGFGVAVLLVASTFTAGASADNSLPVVGTVAHIVQSVTSPITSMLSSPPPQKPTPTKPKVQTADSNKQQTSGPSPNTSATTTPAGSTTNTTTTGAQSTAQAATATLTLATLQCVSNQTTYTLEVPSAQLNMQTPTSAAGNVTWQWETRADSGSLTGQVTSGATSSQPINANASTATLNAQQQAQWLYTATSNNTNDYSFRLHVTGPVDVTSNWVSVPQSANGTCPQVTQ